MKVYCIRKYYCGMDNWWNDEDIFFTEEYLAKSRLQHLQKKYKEDYTREGPDFVKYEVVDKDITLIENYMYLNFFMDNEDLMYEYQPDDDEEH